MEKFLNGGSMKDTNMSGSRGGKKDPAGKKSSRVSHLILSLGTAATNTKENALRYWDSLPLNWSLAQPCQSESEGRSESGGRPQNFQVSAIAFPSLNIVLSKQAVILQQCPGLELYAEPSTLQGPSAPVTPPSWATCWLSDVLHIKSWKNSYT